MQTRKHSGDRRRHLRLGVATEEERAAMQERPEVAGRESQYVSESPLQVKLHELLSAAAPALAVAVKAELAEARDLLLAVALAATLRAPPIEVGVPPPLDVLIRQYAESCISKYRGNLLPPIFPAGHRPIYHLDDFQGHSSW